MIKRDTNKFKDLRSILRRLDSALVAFSGGVDSSFLLRVTKDTLPQDKILAVTAVSDTYTRSELKEAKRFARSLGIKHKIIFTNELKDKNFIKNPVDRCYYCKKELFKKLKNIARRDRFRFVLDASNIDDRKDYRPGSKAKRELGVRSPLEEARWTKKDIRRYSKKIGLKTWDKPQMACLASRFPYGEEISQRKLRKIRDAERTLKRLGVKDVRVRYHKDIARIEVGKKEIKRFFNEKFCDKIVKNLKRLGFIYIALDLEGYRTGSLNEELM